MQKLPDLVAGGWRKTNGKPLANTDLLRVLYNVYVKCPHVTIRFIRREDIPEIVLHVKKVLSRLLLESPCHG